MLSSTSLERVRRACAFRAAAALAAAALGLAGCSDPPAPGYQGYVEGDYVLVAASSAGVLQTLHVQRGQAVLAAAPLFALERASETAVVQEARERVRSAEARARNLSAPRRPRELQALREQLAQANAAQALAAQDLRRAEELQPSGAIATAQLDSARRNAEQAVARQAELAATIELAQQGIGRDAERSGALAEVAAARAVLVQAEWRLAQRSVAAPMSAPVHDTFYAAGEWVAAGRPVLSLLPPGNVKLRFFVPEAVRGSLRVGQMVSVACDGCGTPITATVSHLSVQAEYTPPILYNRESRAKLVYLVEARPSSADAARLHPGQPVDVTLQPPGDAPKAAKP